ncbi:uncharacterized protein LOC134527681 isoform X2 [Bacillus rossius redtenbacheri]|uniref:uncharacterized protein LOC134527681 isoform X2 n=1 Tax=Bacillus rossius redtenbacheri TaxID=93214 RepID=UPI002FDCBB13
MRLIRLQRRGSPGGGSGTSTPPATRGAPRGGHRAGMTEEGCPAASPASDCNSNRTDERTASVTSNASSSQDADFVQDNSDYQWFLDYGYRDGGRQHCSVLSCCEEGYHSDMARHLDANLAELDMETFRSEDINSVLATLPVMCCGDLQVERQGEMFASVSGSMMAKFDFDSSISAHTSSRNDSAGSTDTMSICKSELLFSPVRDCPLPATNFSVDSLDCDHDIMLTCQANKDNYTIAFEGSATLYSEDSDYHEPGDSGRASQSSTWARHCFKPHAGGGRALETSMARSDPAYTTWSKLKKRSSEVQLARHPSGNNNDVCGVGDVSALKSQSLPDLHRRRRNRLLSSASNMASSVESEPRAVKLYDHRRGSITSDTNSSVDGGARRRNFSLVRLFMRQRSASNEGVFCAMDQSSASECWPPSANSQSENDSDSYGQEPRVSARNEINARERCDNARNSPAIIDDDYSCENGNREATEAAETENSTCGFEDSLMEPSRKDPQFHQHELIAEETEEEQASERSESVEQLSESFSKIEESFMDLGANSGISDRAEEILATGSSRSEKKLRQFNVNNNNSVERDAETADKPKPLRERSRRTQTRRDGNVCGSVSSRSSTGGSISNCSSSDETDTTKLQKLPASRRCASGVTTCACHTKSTSTQVPVHLMNRSMQTSVNADTSSLKSSPFRFVESPDGTSLIKIIRPSCDGKLGSLKEGEILKPLYVLFPNYTLPDLGFLKEKRKEIDVGNVFLMPQQLGSISPLKDCMDPGGGEKARKKRSPVNGKSPRPFSCNDVEALRKKGFGHIKDWDSLTFLLPREYCQFLSEVPEVLRHVKGREERPEPLFCVSPPSRARPTSCDCGSFAAAQTAAAATNVSSSSSTATQPSSGYRGSSTMLLTDSSSNHPAPAGHGGNPLFVYRYDSVSSESSLVGAPQQGGGRQLPVLPKRSISLPTHGKGPDTPPRPPLPRSILRKSLCSGSPQYACKVHKNNANTKRYSMFELGGDGRGRSVAGKQQRASYHDAGLTGCLEDLGKKLAERHSPEKDVDELEDEDYDDEGVDAGTDSSFEDGGCRFRARPPTPPLPRTPDEPTEKVLKLEEFLHLSGLSMVVSGDGTETWTEGDRSRLRAEVSKFLLDKNGPRGCADESEDRDCRFGGSSAKKVSFAEKVCVRVRDEAEVKEGTSIILPTPHNSSAVIENTYKHFQGERGSPCGRSECVVPRAAGQSEPTCRSPGGTSPVDMAQKRDLVTAVSDAVEGIVGHFAAARNQDHCARLGSSEHTPACAKLVLSRLCPALYAALGDGLRPELDTIFGPVANSVWQVVEASAQQGVMTKHLNELVLRINSEDIMTEGRVKFNTFVFGLLNVRSLDAWVSYLRTRESIIRKHFSPHGLLLLATTAGAPVHGLLDQLVASLQPLSLLPFQLDLLFESKQLHMSLRRLDAFQKPAAAVAEEEPAKPWTLRKLVRSLQNSLTQSFEDDALPGWPHRSPKSPPKNVSDEEATPLPDLLGERPRPRSGVDSGGFSLVSDLASTVRKRWSGIQLGSKLFQAFDRLTAEDGDDEYPDSLETNLRPDAGRKGSGSSGSTGEDFSEGVPRDGAASPAPSTQEGVEQGTGRFRKLQMKWEMLSGKETSTEKVSPVTSPQSQGSGGSTPSTGRSRIPRLVTSPVRPASGIPVPARRGSQPPKAGSPGMIPRRPVPAAARCSRLDQLQSAGKPARPSSLPYRPPSARGLPVVSGRGQEQHRRAASSSLSRQKQAAGGAQPLQRWVRTLCHRLPSDSGHLSFNEGERLRVVLNVDGKWLLCCRGDRKGLVPRAAVVPLSEVMSARV